MKKKIKIICTLGPSSLNSEFLEYSRNVAIKLLEEDENLEKEENKNILKSYLPYAKERMEWSRIS